MAVLAAQTAAVTGVVPTYNAAAAGGDTFPNDGNTFLEIVNAHASASRTVTITAQGTSVIKEGFGTITIADTAVVLTGPSRQMRFGPCFVLQEQPMQTPKPQAIRSSKLNWPGMSPLFSYTARSMGSGPQAKI